MIRMYFQLGYFFGRRSIGPAGSDVGPWTLGSGFDPASLISSDIRYPGWRCEFLVSYVPRNARRRAIIDPTLDRHS